SVSSINRTRGSISGLTWALAGRTLASAADTGDRFCRNAKSPSPASAPAFTVVATKSRRVNAENMCILPARDAAGTGLSELPGGMKITGTPGKRGRKGRRSCPLDSRSRGRFLAVVEQLVHFFQGLRQQQPILLLLCRLE